MGAEYVRTYYGVPAKRGGRVIADGQLGGIVGFDGAHLRVRLDGERRVGSWHPTWHMKYLGPDGAVTFHQPCTGDTGCCKGGK